jgi:hypothetical protein
MCDVSRERSENPKGADDEKDDGGIDNITTRTASQHHENSTTITSPS